VNGLADLRPGDICFTKIGGFVPGVVPVGLGMLLLGERVRLGPISVDHVGIVTEAAPFPQMVQAMPEGAEEIRMTQDKHWNAWTAYARLPEDWPGQADDAAAIARLMVDEGVDYSFASYVVLAAHLRGLDTPRLNARIARTGDRVKLPRWSNGPPLDATQRQRGGFLPVEAICSQLVDAAWTLAGKEVMRGVRPQVVTPGGLALQLWNREGVEWYGASVLG
jgi:hypothetical protein